MSYLAIFALIFSITAHAEGKGPADDTYAIQGVSHAVARMRFSLKIVGGSTNLFSDSLCYERVELRDSLEELRKQMNMLSRPTRSRIKSVPWGQEGYQDLLTRLWALNGTMCSEARVPFIRETASRALEDLYAMALIAGVSADEVYVK